MGGLERRCLEAEGDKEGLNPRPLSLLTGTGIFLFFVFDSLIYPFNFS